MKARTLLSMAFILLTLSVMPCRAQQVIKLPAPNFPTTMSLAEALQTRRSQREYTNPQPLSDQVLANLLWAACGVSSEDGKITAPSAMNKQDVRVYVCRADGAYLYNAQANTLTQLTDRDLRQAVASRQTFAAEAPVCLVLASDLSLFGRNAEITGAVDVGYVSQNICLACTALGLKTVPRMTMDQATLHSALALPEKTVLLINHPVGY